VDDGTPEDNEVEDTSVETRYVAENLVPGARYSFVVFSVGVGDVKNLEGSTPVIQQTGLI